MAKASKKTIAKKTTVKQAAPKKKPADKAPAKKAAVKKTNAPAKKTSVKKETAPAKAAVKKAAPKKAAPKKAATKMPAKKAVAGKVSKRTAPKADQQALTAASEPIVPAPQMQPSELSETADLETGSADIDTTTEPMPQELKASPDPYRMNDTLPKGKMSNKPSGKHNTTMK